MSKKALLIGINYINSSAELSGCINDIKHMKQYLDNYYPGFEYKILRDDKSESEIKPTRDNIIAGLKWLVADNNANSHLFLHYSGHGSYMRDNSGDEKDRRDETIVPVDYKKNGEIVDDDLFKYLSKPLVKGAKLTCVFDCCHSGTVMDLKYTYIPKYKKRKNNRKRRGIRYRLKKDSSKNTNGNVICFSGCQDKDYSSDAYEEGKYQGAMTYGFLKILNRRAKNNKNISYDTLMKKLTRLLKRKGYTQKPQLSSGSKINFNNKFQI